MTRYSVAIVVVLLTGVLLFSQAQSEIQNLRSTKLIAQSRPSDIDQLIKIPPCPTPGGNRKIDGFLQLGPCTANSAPEWAQKPTNRQWAEVAQIIRRSYRLTPLQNQFVDSKRPAFFLPIKYSSPACITLDGTSPKGSSYWVQVIAQDCVTCEKRFVHSDNKPPLIDGRHIYGTDGGIPKTEISQLRVGINGNELAVPRNAYCDLFDIELCGTSSLFWACENSSGTHLYVFILGGDGAGHYSVKLVFSHEKYETRIFGESDALEQVSDQI